MGKIQKGDWYMKKRGVLLIGMPGAGKTTIGRELSKVLKMNFSFYSYFKSVIIYNNT